MAAQLAHSSHELHLHVRSESGAQMVLEGLELEGQSQVVWPSDRFMFTMDSFEIPTQYNGVSDFVILAFKAHDVISLAPIASILLKPDGVIFALSNGLGHVETLRAAAGADRVLAATTTHGAFREANGSIVWAGRGGVSLGSLPGGPSLDRAAPLIGTFEEVGLHPQWRENAMAMIWEKVLLNVSINPLAAFSGLRNGELLESTLFNGCMMVFRAARQVGLCEGVTVMDELEFEAKLRRVLNTTFNNSCSMLEDMKAGRKTEIEHLNEAIARKAESHGLTCPLNQVLSSLVRACHP